MIKGKDKVVPVVN